ncbi:OsmC family protein [Subtercola sp. PAMC28395]|uniref:OsmC family protein n=1 Tax=Subtercola sp. PAMC28395 TaxID=2846775 RepID=UPI001C0DFB7F|nr:OsmC family protein [Subtercola sp. PAMC28395]QWT23540.1 OsmC family protein [Subtercola sp. PAMC28395]
MNTEHHYRVDVEWQGNRGSGTTGYRDYSRKGVVRASGKIELPTSADRTFHGDRDRWNPEELLLAALAECHMLSYLHVAVQHGVVVTGYTDSAEGVMEQVGQGGHFTSVTLRPVVTLADPGQAELANSLHHEASQLCFIAQSVNFSVLHEPRAQ